MNRLALRLGLYGGSLAFVGSSLVMYGSDPSFQSRSAAQVIQMSLMWFGFTALVGGIVGWAGWLAWSYRAAAEDSRGSARGFRGGSPHPPAGQAAPQTSPMPDEGRPEDSLAGVPPERTAEAIRGSLRQD